MTISKLITSFLMVSLIIIGCKTAKHTETAAVTSKITADCRKESPSYETDIKPILGKNCTRCHGDLRKAKGLNFNKMEDIKTVADNGKLIGTIKWSEGYAHMPLRGDKLDDLSIHKIECWVQTGMK